MLTAERPRPPERALSLSQRLTIGLCMTAVFGMLLVTVSPQSAEARSINRVRGTLSSSWYFSRDLTKAMVTPAGAASVASSLIGGIPGKVLGAAAGAVSIKAAEAASKNQCLRVRYARLPGTPYITLLGLYSDGSRRCWSR